ncbi:hypothetical protein [Aureibaculum luteum]|uniref:hypothetical protein n=1 Tax=Aureibaculum luteum TaxID=1548456 RepID=UPI000E4A74CC|nr:hypothetical protein [Aureibaculum luteum]
MKRWNQILSVVLLISVYCFGIYVPAKTSLSSDTPVIEQKSEQKEFSTTLSNVLYPHTQQFENLFSEFTEFTLPIFKLGSEGFWAVFRSNEILLNAKFKQYKSHLKTQLIRSRKTDLIFPFHNFW